MSVTWTAPMALLGLALIALPIAVHLLVRHQVRTLQYPSLRFLRETQLAALRRRRIEDALLLACRCAIVALAALALAGPVFETAARRAAQSSRISRAIVSVGGSLPADVQARLTAEAFAASVIARERMADGLRDALRWLDSQPRSAREVVIAGELRRGDIIAADLEVVPPDVGIRFEQTATDRAGDTTVALLARRNGSFVRIDQSIAFTADATRISEGTVSPVPSDLVTIIARDSESALAGAALRAALDGGVPWRDFSKKILIAWEGVDDSTISARSNGAEVRRMRSPVPESAAADAVRAELIRAGGVGFVEPIAIARDTLDAWSRRPGAPSVDAPVADEGDRRYVWILALALLGVEWRLRRSKTASVDQRQSTEVRVA